MFSDYNDNVLVSFPFFLQHQQSQVQATNDVHHKWTIIIIINLNNCKQQLTPFIWCVFSFLFLCDLDDQIKSC